MQRYLLDTSTVSDLAVHPQGRVAVRIAEEGEDAVCTSIVVAAELRFGAAKKGSERLTAQLDAILSVMEVLPLDEPVDHHYARISQYLEKAGTPIGPNDMLIAAHARALGLVVVTANVREFARVPALAVDNWLAD